MIVAASHWNCPSHRLFALPDVAASLLVELEAHGASLAWYVGFVFGAEFIVACQPFAGGLEDRCAGLDSADHQVVDPVSVLL